MMIVAGILLILGLVMIVKGAGIPGGGLFMAGFWTLIGSIVVWGLFLLVALVGPASAQDQKCGSLDVVIGHLEGRYAEVETWRGEANNGTFFVLYENEDRGTWTMIQVRGPAACMRASGGNPEPLPKETQL